MEARMLSIRSGKILNSIIRQYIIRAAPVPSQNIAEDAGLKVSPATIRNEMSNLEHEGYLIRPHTSAGCIPSDKGYRYYVESIKDAVLPNEEQRLISHTFHQVEKEVETWISLTASLLAQLVQNVAVVSLPKSTDCKLKHVEIIALQDARALAVVVLYGAKVKQKRVTFKEAVTQEDLGIVCNKLNAACYGLTGQQIQNKKHEMSDLEKQATDFLVEIMEAEDSQDYQEPYLEGWHFILNQPEFAQSDHMRALMELVENRGLLKVIVPSKLNRMGVHVIIGSENKEEAIQNCSVVICQYGLPDEATGTIGVVGPTRMPYSRTIPTVYYLSSILSGLVAGLYGQDVPGIQD
jgi:heat-inducible transcriptional repressor